MAKRITSYPGKYSSDAEMLSIKNFILTRARKVDGNLTIGSSFVFDGIAALICLNGHGVIKMNYKEFEVSKNQVFLIMPFQIISVMSVEKGSSIAGIFIGKDYMTKTPVVNIDFDVFFQLGSHPVITLTDKEMENLMALHAVILTRYRNINNPYKEICLTGLVFSFIAELRSLYDKNKPWTGTPAPSRQERITDNFFRLLLNNFKQERSVAYYADKLCFSPKYLSKVIKQVTGHTVQDWINEIVIIHIKNLLKTTDKTVLEISEEMNFSNPSFFGRFFKQYTGMTPMQFRLKG